MSDDVTLNDLIQAQVNHQQIDWWLNLIGISTLAGSCAAIISDDMRTFKGIARCSILAVLAGYIVSSVADAYGINTKLLPALLGLSGLYANYIFIFMLKLSKMAVNDPMAIVNFFLTWLPGRKPKAD